MQMKLRDYSTAKAQKREKNAHRFRGLLLLLMLALVAFVVACGPKEPEIAIRVLNFTDGGLEDVVVQYPEGDVSYGAMRRLSQTPYIDVFDAYTTATMQVVTEEQTYSFEVDAEPQELEAGQYAYVVHFANDDMQVSWINEGEPHRDPDLIDTHWLWQEWIRPNGESYTVVSSKDNETPGMLLTDNLSLNEALLGLVFGTYTGCNGGGGGFHTNADGQLIMQLVTQDGDECNDEITAAEEALLNVVNGISSYEIANDTLRVTVPSGDVFLFSR